MAVDVPLSDNVNNGDGGCMILFVFADFDH